MIQGYAVDDGRLRPVDAPFDALDQVVWFDMHDPTEAEESALEAAIGVDVPTRDEMLEIEDSSRLYVENGAIFMTANLPSRMETAEPVLAPVTFILAGQRLVTLRYHEPRAFRTFAAPRRARRSRLHRRDGRARRAARRGGRPDGRHPGEDRPRRGAAVAIGVPARPGQEAQQHRLRGGAAGPRPARRPPRQRRRQPGDARTADRLPDRHKLAATVEQGRRRSGSRRSDATPASSANTPARCRRS